MISGIFPKKFLLHSLLACCPLLVSAQAGLEACLTAANVTNIGSSSASWAAETTAWQLRIRVNPSAIAFPGTREQVAASISCARDAKVNVNPYGGGHSFAAFGFGNDGNLVVNLEAFQDMNYDTSTQLFTFGGGVRVGPALDYLWNVSQRHFPHVRLGAVGLVGSSIGAGWGSTSRFLGTPGDNIVAVEYMLANGTIVIGGEGSDLLWAAQGAGASYGVILSMTTKTWAPVHPNAVNYTITIGRQSLDVGAKAIIDIQDWASTAPDELSLRFAIPRDASQPYSATGYFYGEPSTFNDVFKPLMDKLPAGSNLTSMEQDFWTLEKQIAPGTGTPNGGSVPGRSFYIQALTITSNAPLDITAATGLLNGTTYTFNRTDLRASGFLDVWGGKSRDISDADYSHQHGGNIWLIRLDGTLVTAGAPYPADGVSYFQSLLRPFQDYLIQQGIPLRGFGNYRDTALTMEEWSGRLYGEANWARLLKIKKAIDPTGLFTSTSQSIPIV